LAALTGFTLDTIGEDAYYTVELEGSAGVGVGAFWARVRGYYRKFGVRCPLMNRGQVSPPEKITISDEERRTWHIPGACAQTTANNN
jgi:hypothetical protein